jgi:hypothetical protein
MTDKQLYTLCGVILLCTGMRFYPAALCLISAAFFFMSTDSKP